MSIPHFITLTESKKTDDLSTQKQVTLKEGVQKLLIYMLCVKSCLI